MAKRVSGFRMGRAWRILTAASMIATGGCASAALDGGGSEGGPARDEATAPEGRKRLRVIGMNDFHGHLRPTRPAWAEGREVGGAAAVAAYVNLARAGIDGPAILLDGGDVMQGAPISNLTMGSATVEFYNALGVTAAAVGNHEFDWGADVLKERIEQAEFAWLAANIFVKGTDTLPSWGRATATVMLPGCQAGPPACDSVRVGIIGIATGTTPIAAMPSFVAPFDFGDEEAAIDHWVPVLRGEGADFVIVTAHEGAYCAIGPSDDCSGPMIEIAARLAHPPDLIVSGHSHTLLDIKPSGVPVVQASSYGYRLSIVDLERVSEDSVAVGLTMQPVLFVDEIVPDPEIATLIASHEVEVGPVIHEVVTTTSDPLLRTGSEYPLGNLIADAQRAATGTQVALINNGGIRTELPAGEVRYDDLFRAQPFANTLVTMSLSGEELLAVLEHALRGGRASAHVSGVRVRYRASAALGERLVDATLDSGEVISPSGRYTLSANNFLVEGGDWFSMLPGAADIVHTGLVDLYVLIAWLRGLPAPVAPPPIGRFIAVDP